jgi:Rad3-related DNA helicase
VIGACRVSDFEYRPAQVKAANKVLLNLEEIDNLILNGPTGCLVGSTEINLNRASNGFRISLQEAYEHWVGSPLSVQYGLCKCGCGHSTRISSQTHSGKGEVKGVALDFVRGHKNRSILWDKSTPTLIRSLCDNNISLNQVIDIVQSGIKPVYELRLENGFTLVGTHDHEILSSKGWTPLGSLRRGDTVAIDFVVPFKSGISKRTKNIDLYVTGMINHPFSTTLKASKKNPKGNARTPIHRIVFESIINNLSVDEFINRIRENDRVSDLLFVNPALYHVHHADGDHSNNDPGNLVLTTISDHNKLHKRHENFNNSIPGFVPVRSILFVGEEMTYDVKCAAPHHNFSANGIIVHNCGKSGIAFLLHERLREENPDHKTTIFCNQKLLQDQYADFLDDKDDIMVMKGKSNYECFNDPRVTVEDAPCQHGISCKDKDFCEYWQRRKRLPYVPLLIINYHMVLSLLDTETGWTRKTDLSIYDESHSLADIITDYYKISVSNQEIPYYQKIWKLLEKVGTEKEVIKYESFCARTDGSKGPIASLMDDLDAIMHGIASLRFEDPMDIVENLFMSKISITTTIANLLQQQPDFLMKNKHLLSTVNSLLNRETNFCHKCQHWHDFRERVRYVPDFQRRDEIITYSLTPLKVDTVVEPLLKTLSPKRQFMSATIFPRVFMGYVGIKDNYRHLQLPNNIPVENRQIIMQPIASFNSFNLKQGEPEFEDLIGTLISLLEMHAERDESGVIFTPSYNLSFLLKRSLEKAARQLDYTILINQAAEGRDSVIENFRNVNNKRRLLISPSFSEGINFEDDISRFQVVVKAPFRSLGDAFVKERMKVDKEWYELDCLIRVIQSLGRSCRHVNDFCISYVFDLNVLRLYQKYQRDVPQWFKDSVVIQN